MSAGWIRAQVRSAGCIRWRQQQIRSALLPTLSQKEQLHHSGLVMLQVRNTIQTINLSMIRTSKASCSKLTAQPRCNGCCLGRLIAVQPTAPGQQPVIYSLSSASMDGPSRVPHSCMRHCHCSSSIRNCSSLPTQQNLHQAAGAQQRVSQLWMAHQTSSCCDACIGPHRQASHPTSSPGARSLAGSRPNRFMSLPQHLGQGHRQLEHQLEGVAAAGRAAERSAQRPWCCSGKHSCPTSCQSAYPNQYQCAYNTGVHYGAAAEACPVINSST